MPEEVELRAEGPTIRLRLRGTPFGMDADLSFETGSSLCADLENVLDQIQDEVAEVTTEPWPARAPDPMPEVFAEIRGDNLVVGFGDPHDPALALGPLALADLARR
jgi:hypothetical protein